jgi:hypothetical protein
MPCGKKFGKILKGVKKEYPSYSNKRQMKIAWGIMGKQKKRR